MLTEEINTKVNYWLNGPFDEKTKAEVRHLQQTDPKALIDAFFCDLTFGTGGLRALMGPGTNRLNIYTIRLATQALANYLRKQSPKDKCSVLIGFDSRHHSKEFAEEAAKVLAGNQIKVYLLSELRPTPYVSFALRHKKASAGIMITASHNPKEYNGYKVYWSDGAQVVAPHDEGIVQEAKNIKDLSLIKMSTLQDPLIEIVPTSLDLEYLKAIEPLQYFKEIDQKKGPDLKIVYTSLHGTGITLVPKALKKWGFSSLHFVEEQITLDPDFSTVKFPNPEYKEALQLGITHLEKIKGDILLATDPDADRIGGVVSHLGKSVIISGNEMAAICVDFLCEVLPKLNQMPPNAAFITTIVTTELLKEIATAHKTLCFEVLTGFKYIGELIHLWEIAKKGNHFIFGAEESYGYLLGTQARDKDAIITSCLIAEIALYAKLQGQTLIDRLHAIYKTFGLFREKQLSLNFSPGKEGMDKMADVMQKLRSHPLKQLLGISVVSIEDYEKRVKTDLTTNQTKPLTLPVSDVLLFYLQDQTKIVIRPSGTEPKIKIYAANRLKEFSRIDTAIQICDKRLADLFEELKQQVEGYIVLPPQS